MNKRKETPDLQPYVIYARRSQWNDDESIERQIRNCRAYAVEKPWTKPGIFKEYARGYDDPLHGRGELLKMMEYVKEHGIKIIVVDHIDRLSRSVMQGAYLLHWFNSLGILIHDVEYLVSGKADKGFPSQGWQYRKKLYERLVKAEDYYHAHKLSRQLPRVDKVLFRGRTAPLGFRYEGPLPAKLIKDEETAEVVDGLFKLAHKHAKASLRKQGSGGAKLSYPLLFQKMSLDPDFGDVQAALAKTRARKRVRDAQALKTLLQNPFYAGYAQAGEQHEANMVHEHYINAKDYNHLNRGHKNIQLESVRPRSYIPLIGCSCGQANFNKEDKIVICRACGKRYSRRDLELAIMEKLRHYRVETDATFLDHMARYLKMGLLGALLHEVKTVLQPRAASGKAAVDKLAMKHAGGGRDLLNKIAAVLRDIDQYQEKGYGELAVLWLEACRDDRQREFIEGFGLEMVYDTDLSEIVLYYAKPEVVWVDDPKSMAEIEEFVRQRNSLFFKIAGEIEKSPALKAVLEYDAGYASGDLWTRYHEMLLKR